jgi:TP901 family phage tail tape measure protein
MADEIRLDVSANTTPMERDIADARRRVGTITLNANMDSRGMENFNRSLGKITGQADEFSKSMEAANARVLAFGASVGVINAISNAFKNLVSSTVEVEKSLTEIKTIGNETFSDLSKTSAGLFNVAKQLGVSYKDAADSTLEFARQGKDLTASLDASRAALALTRTAGIAATDAVMGLTSAVNAFGRGADAYIEYANKMSAVSDSFAVNNKDLIEGLSRSASVAQEAGVSFEQLTAFITTLQEKTGRGGAVIGNALKTIFTRVQNPEIIKDLRDLGISVQDATTGSFLPATQIIQNLANEFQGFDKNLRNSVLLKVGGGFQVDKLAALLNDVKSASGTFQSSLNIATSGSGNILGKVAQLNQTVDSSFNNVLTASKQLGSNIGQIAFSKDFADILRGGASAITSINEAIFGNGGKDAEDQGSSIGKAVLKGIGSIVSGPGLALFIGILGKLSLDFAKFSTSGLQTLLGITSKSKEEQLIQTAITNVLSRNANFQQEIFNLEGNRVAQANLLLGVIRQQVAESKKLEEISRGVSPILQQAGVRLSGGAPQVIGSAKGYIPNLAGAIAKERSESPAGSRIIVDRNFPMGGGQRSTMVYNSNETRIPNFRGSGGDAIIPNYPVSSAKGYTPNFAEPKQNVLNVDARAASIAGITFAGEGNGVLDKAKPYPLNEENLKKYAGSNLLDTLQKYENFNVINLPVGNAYRFRKGLEGSEDKIKSDFISKLNSKFRSEIVNFLLQEVSDIGLKPGAGLASNLSNIKLDVIGTSTAGYLFEELLKIPTLTDAEKIAQYSSQSSTEAFDVKNLEPGFAEAYGLPRQKFDYAEIKLGQKQLKDDISRKLLNQTVLEGGGANPAKFGIVKRAASGYVPNFAKKTAAQMKKFPRIEYNLNKSERNKDYLLSPLDEVILNSRIAKEVMPLLKGESPLQYEERALKNYSKFKSSKSLRYSGSSAIDGYSVNSNNSVDFLEVKSGGFDIEDVRDKFYRAIFENYGAGNDISKLLTPNKDSFNITGTLVKSAAKGYVPNFANINADILTANPMISETSLDEFVNKYLGQNYSTGLSGTSANVKKLTNPSLAPQAKRDFLMSMLGVNFLATFNRDKDANISRKSLMDAKTKTGSRKEYVPGGFMQQAGNYTKPDYTNVIEGAFSGKVKELKYEELDSRAEKIFSDTGLSSVWNNDIINTLMQVAEKHSQSEMVGGNFQYRGSEEYKKVKAATGILRPALINGLLEGEKGVQGLLLNTPEADKSVVGKNSKYLALLDPNAANLQKYISDFLINPNREPLDPNSSEAQQNLMNASDLVRTLDTYSPSAYGRKPIRLNALKEARDKARSNAQLRTFFGETAGAFQPIRKGADGSLGTTFKSSFPQEVIDRMTNVLTSTVNRGGIFQLSNLDFGYAGTPEEAFEFKKGQDVDTFKNSPSFNAPQSSVAYGEYKNNKAYYDSIAKWKYDAVSKSMIRQAAKGYIPNFSELTGTGSGMMYQDPNYTELGGGGSGKFLAPKSGQGFGQKIFYKQGSDKITQEYGVNKSIKDFEKENPALFAKNAISFTNVGKILTKNGLAAGFEREVIGGAGVDEFATGTFPNQKGAVSAKAEFAFFLSELLAQAGVKNVVGEYRKKYGANSLSIDDVYAQNFKLNDLMQSSIIGETKQFFAKKKGISSNEVSAYINSLRGNPLLDSLNEKFGSAGARHTMFDTQGFSKNVQTASKGYIPNFASSVEDAINREKAATGLPDSMIKVSKDSRAKNPSLNPSGTIVTNKIDEPRGGMDVPNSRMINAYNSSKGFIPNFSGKLGRAFNAGASGDVSTVEEMVVAQANTGIGASSATTTAVVAAQKDLVNEILNYISSLRKTRAEEDKMLAVLAREESILNNLNNVRADLIPILSNRISRELSNAGGGNFNDISNIINPQNSLPAQSRTPLATSAGASAGTPTSGANPPSAPDPKEATKSFGDLALAAFKFQSVLSATSGFLSVFGKEAEKAGEIINTLGQGAYAATQGLEVVKSISGGKSIGSIFKTIGSSFREGSSAAGAGGGGLLRRIGAGTGAVIGQGATATAAATGLGGGLTAAASLLAPIALITAGIYVLGKGVDQFSKIINGANSRTEKSLNLFTSLQEKYNLQLSERGRGRVSKLSDLSDISGTGFSGFLNELGIGLGGSTFRKMRAEYGGKDYTYKDRLTKTIAGSKLNLDSSGNKGLSELIGPYLDPIAVEKTMRTVNGKKVEGLNYTQNKQLAEEFQSSISEIDKLIKEETDKAILKNIEKYREDTYNEILSKKTYKIPQPTKGLQEGENDVRYADQMAALERTKEKDRNDADNLSRIKAKSFVGTLNADQKQLINDTAVSKYVENIAPKAVEAQARLDAEKQGILIQTELLKKRLEITQQIAKIEGTIPSALESSLSIQKELLSTNEGTKFSLDLQLKNLQEERQTRAEIKDLFSTEARDVISKNLEKTASLGVTAPRTQQINVLFNNLQASQGVEDQKKAYSEIVNQLDLSVSRQIEKIELLKQENDYLSVYDEGYAEIIAKNNEEIKQLSIVNEQLKQRTALLQGSLDVINKQSQARKIQIAQAAQERAITEKSNYYYTLQKDIFSAQIEIQNKKLEKAKQELDLRRQMRDLSFEEMQFADKTKTEPRKQYEAGMFAAQSKETDTLTDVRTRNAEKDQAYRQSLYNDISSRTNNLQTMSDASKAATSGNTKELERLFSQAFGEQAQTFDQKVLSAADQFAKVVVQSAIDAEAVKRGEKPSTSYEAITSGKPFDEIMRDKYGDYKSKADITKDIERLRSLAEEGSGSYSIEEINSKIAELEKISNQTLQDAAEVKKQSLKPVGEDETQIAKNAKRRKELEQGKLTQGESERTTFTGGFKLAKREIDEQIETFNSRLGRDIPMAFRDSMVSAMRELSNPNSTQPLKERLLGVASAFLNKINEAFMTQSANKITSSIMGVMPGMASGGYIKGGSGSKDDVPAMLMGGEYVVKKNAVQKYGPSFFDALNNGSIKKFANGGWVESDVTKYQDPASINPYGQRRDQGLSFNENGSVIGMDSYTGTAENKQDAMMRAQTDYYAKNAQTGQGGFYMPGENGMGAIMGAQNLLSFATQQTAGTRFDRISGSRNSASVDLGAGSSNMSLFALRDQGNARNAEYLQSKQKSLDLFFSEIDASKEKANREEEIRKEQERIKEEAKKQEESMIKGILTNLAISAAMAGLGALGKAASKGWNATNQASNGTATIGEKFKGAFTGGTMGGETRGGMLNAFSSSGYKDFSVIGSNTGQGLYEWNKKGGYYNEMTDRTFAGKYGTASDADMLGYDRLGTPYSLNQKKIPQANLRNMRNPPFYDRRAAGGYVAGNGMGDNVPAMLNGGEFVVSKQAAQNIGANKLQQINSGVASDSSELIAAKLDELVEKLSAVGTLNITVNSDSKGSEQSKEEGGNQDKQTKELARKIKEVVMVVLKDEKRLGGMLR